MVGPLAHGNNRVDVRKLQQTANELNDLAFVHMNLNQDATMHTAVACGAQNGLAAV